MRDRYLKLVTAIVTSAICACNDAAVEDITAPPIAATPASPVAEQWPYDYEFAGIPAALGLQININSVFENQNRDFAVGATVTFQWANDVSASIWGKLLNSSGQVINSGTAGVGWRRLALPVASGDTTLSLKLSTNNITCGLVGKSGYQGHAAWMAINANSFQVSLLETTVGPTDHGDALQPACTPDPPDECDATATRIRGAHGGGVVADLQDGCDEAPVAPSGGSTEIWICYVVWREVWTYDWMTGQYAMVAVFPIGVFCRVAEI